MGFRLMTEREIDEIARELRDSQRRRDERIQRLAEGTAVYQIQQTQAQSSREMVARFRNIVEDVIFVATRGFVRLWFLWVPVVLIVLVGGWFVNSYSYMFTGVSPHQVPTALPQVVAIPTDSPRQQPWDNIEWLSVDEAKGLRQKSGVINFAYLDGKSVRYAKSVSYLFSREAPWKVNNAPYGIQAVSVEGSAVQLMYNGETYFLNVSQPFSARERPELIWAIDLDGKVWQMTDDSQPLLPLDRVVQNSVIRVKPNPSLSLTLP